MLSFKRFKDKFPGLTVDIYFVGTCLDILSLTIIIYFLGGLSWIGPFFYSLVIINVFWFLPVDKAIFVIGLSFFSLASLISLGYFEVIPNFYVFSPTENIQNFYYFFTTALGAATIVFFLSYGSNTFRRILDDQIENLQMAEKKLQEVKEVLAIEVQERTEDLEREKKRLEEEVKKRTKELEERKKVAQAKAEELGKFHNMAVERELEMVQLKEEIANFKNKK
jgi:signal transduction histidine kinase